MVKKDAPYHRADLYALAFSFRDIPRECDALLAIMEEHGRPCRSFLEAACGPGEHVVEMARRGIRSTGLDREPAMLALLRRDAAAAGVQVGTLEADMRAFEATEVFDGALIAMDSAALLLGSEDLTAHLRSMAACLPPSGLYVLEMAHPANHFRTAKTSGNHWTTEGNSYALTVTWGLPEDPFDPLTQIGDVTVVWEVAHADGRCERFVDHERAHKWTKAHFESVVELEGSFEIAAWYGSLDREIPLSNEKEAWRMVPVLRRR
jgi:SAM-dependent methyltransferase